MSRPIHRSSPADWPAIPYSDWKDTCSTLQLMTQIVGKVRLTLTPWTNHSWHMPLYVTLRGMSTSPIPYGGNSFQVDFDFREHKLVIETLTGERHESPLVAQPIADFYAHFMEALASCGIQTSIRTTPSEIPDAIPFDHDREHESYDADAVNRFWRALVQIDRVFKEFRAGFVGKNSPVHFFWGSFDLAVTRFSGREAPPHPGGVPNFPDWVAREAYSHEVSSAGFWPGGGPIDYPAFYSYAYPGPEGFAEAPVEPKEAFFSKELGEFLLPYDAVRTAESPDETLLAFLQSTYVAAADLAGWKRGELETESFQESFKG
jgi:hypothetical protein